MGAVGEASRRPPAPRPAPVSRAPAAPDFVREIGGMVALAGTALRRSVTPPFSWAAEFVAQFRFILKVCFFPLILTSFALSFGPAGIQASNFFGLVGATDRMGGAYVIIVVRMFAPLVSAIVIAGAAGTAICADLGARLVREEIAALTVLGVDPIRSLVVPRVLALVARRGPLQHLRAAGGHARARGRRALQNGGALGPVFSTFFSNANPLELRRRRQGRSSTAA